MHQILEQSLRLQLRRFLEPLRDLLPVLRKRILPRAPSPQPLLQRRQLTQFHVPSRRIPVHPGSQRRQPELAMLAYLLPQFSHLYIRHHLPAPLRIGQELGFSLFG